MMVTELFYIRGVTREGQEVWYQGGSEWVSTDKARAMPFRSLKAARTRAKIMNRRTSEHGVHFMAPNPDTDRETEIELEGDTARMRALGHETIAKFEREEAEE